MHYRANWAGVRCSVAAGSLETRDSSELVLSYLIVSLCEPQSLIQGLDFRVALFIVIGVPLFAIAIGVALRLRTHID